MVGAGKHIKGREPRRARPFVAAVTAVVGTAKEARRVKRTLERCAASELGVPLVLSESRRATAPEMAMFGDLD